MLKRRKTKRGKIDRRGAAVKLEHIRLSYGGKAGEVARFNISEDIVKSLVEMHHALFGLIYMGNAFQRGMTDKDYDPYTRLRVQFQRFEDIGIAGFIMRIEPPTFDPRGHRLWKRQEKSHQYTVQVRARDIGLVEAMPATNCEFLFEPKLPRTFAAGMMVIVPDEYMKHTGPKRRRRAGDDDTLRAETW